jgi:hypothetical protein
VHVEPTPVRPPAGAAPDSTNPYESPSIATTPEESTRPRARDAGAPSRFPNEANDDATNPEERFLNLRE